MKKYLDYSFNVVRNASLFLLIMLTALLWLTPSNQNSTIYLGDLLTQTSIRIKDKIFTIGNCNQSSKFFKFKSDKGFVIVKPEDFLFLKQEKGYTLLKTLSMDDCILTQPLETNKQIIRSNNGTGQFFITSSAIINIKGIQRVSIPNGPFNKSKVAMRTGDYITIRENEYDELMGRIDRLNLHP